MRGALTEDYPYLILDARYEKVREDGVIQSQAVLMAIGINWEGSGSPGGGAGQPGEPDQLAGVPAGAEAAGLERGRVRGLRRPRGAEAGDAEILPEAAWQRCYVHFLRNALDYLPRKADDDCLKELRWIYDRRNLDEAQRDLAAWLGRWQKKYPKLCDWVEENIGETLTFYRLPRPHHKHLKSTNMLERLNEEIRRRTRVVRIFPNAASCLRLMRALWPKPTRPGSKPPATSTWICCASSARSSSGKPHRSQTRPPICTT